jgi:YebC/PmpR family DNA-binding regulatory protein
MSGHNKWSQIVRQKTSEDGKRSKLFSMMGRMIAVQSRLANGDVNSAGLRTAIEKARKANMPIDTIERAVKKGTGAGEAAMEEVVYEAFGPGGVAIVISGITDSRNRTSNEIKNILSDHSGSLGGPGAVMWAFASSRNESGDIIYSPTTKVPVEESDIEKLTALITTLEDHDDVKSVATNAE